MPRKTRAETGAAGQFATNEVPPYTIVQLRSGGPWMTVAEVAELDADKGGGKVVICDWFNQAHDAQRAEFIAGMLEIIRLP